MSVVFLFRLRLWTVFICFAVIVGLVDGQGEDGGACQCPDGEQVSLGAAASDTDVAAKGYILRVRVRGTVKDTDKRGTWVAKVKRVYRQPECDPVLQVNDKILVTAPKDDCFYQDFGEKNAAYLLFPERTTDANDDRETFRISNCYPNDKWTNLKGADELATLKRSYPASEGTVFGTACSSEEGGGGDPVDPERSAGLDDVIDALVDSGVTDRDILQTVESPQRLAAEWILGDEIALDEDNVVQRFTLATFYYATNGDDWFFAANFLSQDDECTWFGITCNDEGQVIGLNFVVNNLSGVLPEELGRGLPKLQDISLSSNNIEGTLPLSLGDLVDLTTVLLSRNNMIGEPLFGLKDSTNLTQIFLSENMFSGPIPTVVASILRLEILVLDGNQFTGSLPVAVGQLASLQTLDVSDNLLTGVLSPDLFAAWGSMTQFKVDNNLLEGPLPVEASLIGRFNFFDSKELDFSFNQFEGAIPLEYANIPLLEKLLLVGNELTGTMPPAICALVGTGFFGPALVSLTVNCEDVECNCCTNCG